MVRTVVTHIDFEVDDFPTSIQYPILCNKIHALNCTKKEKNTKNNILPMANELCSNV